MTTAAYTALKQQYPELDKLPTSQKDIVATGLINLRLERLDAVCNHLLLQGSTDPEKLGEAARLDVLLDRISEYTQGSIDKGHTPFTNYAVEQLTLLEAQYKDILASLDPSEQDLIVPSAEEKAGDTPEEE